VSAPEIEQAAQTEVAAKPVKLGYEIKPVAKSESDDGGVQQWREDEMADDATALTEAPVDAPVVPATLIAFAVMICGMFTQYKMENVLNNRLRKMEGGAQ